MTETIEDSVLVADELDLAMRVVAGLDDRYRIRAEPDGASTIEFF